MLKLFQRAAPRPAPDTRALGGSMLALRMEGGATVPASCIGLAFDKTARTRRIAAGARLVLDAQERAFCFHPGPYCIDLLPFEAAPELGLRLSFVAGADAPRFDLYLASEAGAVLDVAAFAAAIEAELQRELAQGNLELAPCTSVDEWHAFQAGLNQLLYTRFGVIAEDCVPVDLGDKVDYAAMLAARASSEPVSVAQAGEGAVLPEAAPDDAQALRRLFLELPGLTSALRLASLPPGQGLFRQHQGLLQRLEHVGLDIATMPALALAAPGRALDATRQQQRAAHSVRAAQALDEAWALVARLALAACDHAALLDEADRIVANLESQCSARRAVPGELA